MADLERIKADITEIAHRRKTTTLSDIARIVRQLGLVGFVVNSRATRHGVLFTVGEEIFQICGHNPGRAHIKPAYVDEFIDSMTNLGLYEE